MIYILDYDTDIAFVLNEWLQLHGFETKSFTTLTPLLQHLKIQHPQCILLDCAHGRHALLSGVCHIIRKELKYTGRIILISTNAISNRDLQLCNADGFMAKPFDFNRMIAMLHEQVKTVE